MLLPVDLSTWLPVDLCIKHETLIGPHHPPFWELFSTVWGILNLTRNLSWPEELPVTLRKRVTGNVIEGSRIWWNFPKYARILSRCSRICGTPKNPGCAESQFYFIFGQAGTPLYVEWSRNTHLFWVRQEP